MSSDIEYRELMAKKRKLIASMKRAKRKVIKLRVIKNKVNEELKKIKARFALMTFEEARASVASELDAISTQNIFPKKMERDFDRMDNNRTGSTERKIIDLTGQDTGISMGGNVRMHQESDGDVVVVSTDDTDTEPESIPDIDIGEDELHDDEEVIDFSDQ